MGKLTNNPFAINPAMKFGVSPDPSILRPAVRYSENRSGVRRVPQNTGAYRGAEGWSNASNANDREQRASAAQQTDNERKRAFTVSSVNTRPSNENLPSSGGTMPKTGQKSGVNDKASTKGRSSGSIHTVKDGVRLNFSEQNLLQGFIMSEILGKPKCLKRDGGRV